MVEAKSTEAKSTKSVESVNAPAEDVNKEKDAACEAGTSNQTSRLPRPTKETKSGKKKTGYMGLRKGFLLKK